MELINRRAPDHAKPHAREFRHDGGEGLKDTVKL